MYSPGSLNKFAVFIAAATLAFAARARDAAYDPSFDNDGRTWIDVTSATNDDAENMIPLPNGNLFMSGNCDGDACAVWLAPLGSKAPTGNFLNCASRKGGLPPQECHDAVTLGVIRPAGLHWLRHR